MRKKNNNVQRMRKLADCALKGIAVCFVGKDDENCHIVSEKQKKIVIPGRTLVNAITQVPHHWCVMLAVFGIDSSGKEYFKSEVIRTTSRYYHRDINEMLVEHHERIMANFNSNHLIQSGWLASPGREDWSEQEAAEIFELFSPWELKQ